MNSEIYLYIIYVFWGLAGLLLIYIIAKFLFQKRDFYDLDEEPNINQRNNLNESDIKSADSIPSDKLSSKRKPLYLTLSICCEAMVSPGRNGSYRCTECNKFTKVFEKEIEPNKRKDSNE